MTHPSKELFLQWYQQAASAPMAWLLTAFEESVQYPQYTLLSSFIARGISGKLGAQGDTPQALSWADKAMGLLDNKNTLKKAYGGDEDYLASVQACVVLKVRWLSLSDEHVHWYKAKDLAQSMLATGFPSIYLRGSSSKDGVALALMLMGVYNRLGEHAKAMELGTRVQLAAAQHEDAATECRASFNWAVATLLLSKQYAVEQKSTDARAALDSACHVLLALCANPDMRALLGIFVDAVSAYGTLLQAPADASPDQAAMDAFANRWSIETQWGLLDVVQMHSSAQDEILADAIIGNLDDASAGA